MTVLADLGTTFSTTASSGPLLLGLAASAAAGLVSFASPCIVPLVPGYLSYLAGISGAEAFPTAGKTAVRTGGRWRVTAAAGLFVTGFTTVFTLGTASVFGLIGLLAVNADLLQRAGGVITIVMGIAFLGLIPALQRDTRPQPKYISNIAGAPLLGAVFGLGWTPCLGPTLAGVLSVAAGTEGTTAARGVALILAYCVGLGLPFVALAYGSSRAMTAVAWMRRHSRKIQIVGGVTLILVGTALVTGAWMTFVSWLRDNFVSNAVLPI